jgi:hypothetical protein
VRRPFFYSRVFEEARRPSILRHRRIATRTHHQCTHALALTLTLAAALSFALPSHVSLARQEGSPRPARWVFYGDSSADDETIVVGDFAPQLACFWLKKEAETDASEEGSGAGEGVLREQHTLRGVFLESGTEAVVAQLPGVARAQPRVDAAALRAARSVEEALQRVGVKV